MVVLFTKIGNLAGVAVGQRPGIVMSSECSPECEIFVNNSVEMSRGQLVTQCTLTAQLLLCPTFLPTLIVDYLGSNLTVLILNGYVTRPLKCLVNTHKYEQIGRAIHNEVEGRNRINTKTTTKRQEKGDDAKSKNNSN